MPPTITLKIIPYQSHAQLPWSLLMIPPLLCNPCISNFCETPPRRIVTCHIVPRISGRIDARVWLVFFASSRLGSVIERCCRNINCDQTQWHDDVTTCEPLFFYWLVQKREEEEALLFATIYVKVHKMGLLQYNTNLDCVAKCSSSISNRLWISQEQEISYARP